MRLALVPLRRFLLVFLLVLVSPFATPLAAAAGSFYIETGIQASGLVVCAGIVAHRTYTLSATITRSIESLDDGSEHRTVTRPDGLAVETVSMLDGSSFNGSGTMTARFVYGTRPDVPDYMIKGGALYRMLTDHLGSVRLVVRLSDGAIVQQLAYDPWGDVEIDTKPGFQPFGFAGGLYDSDTRLVRFGARDYDPAIGRWTAKDPSGFAGGTNLYAYADNDPVNLVDLTGQNPVFFLLAGAMRGIGEDILFQMVVQGKRWGCLDGQELAMAGVLGALTGGLGAPAATAGTSIPWSSGSVTRAARLLDEGATSVRVANRAEAAELFLGKFQGAGYRNTTGLGNRIYDKSMTYHWDEIFGADGFLKGHAPTNPHATVPHLQIHTPTDVIRIFF